MSGVVGSSPPPTFALPIALGSPVGYKVPSIVKGRYCPVCPNGEPRFSPLPATTQFGLIVYPAAALAVAAAAASRRPASAHVGVKTLAMRGVTPGELTIAAATLPGRAVVINWRNCEVSTHCGVETLALLLRKPS